MSFIFYNCRIKTLDEIKNWSIKNVKSLRGAFSCSSINSFDAISNWNTYNVEDMRNLFKDQSITNLNFLKNCNTNNFILMDSMFHSCQQLISLEGISNWDVSKVEKMNELFRDCISLSYLKLFQIGILKILKKWMICFILAVHSFLWMELKTLI